MNHEYTADFLERFWEKIDRKDDPDTCWNWLSGTVNGYGRTTFSGHDLLSHRVSFELANGPFPDDLHVLHSCDNPACCNPAHLFLGTDLDNARDRESKGRGRQPRGERNGRCKASDDQVREIRSRYANGDISSRKLASEYNFSHRGILYIVKSR